MTLKIDWSTKQHPSGLTYSVGDMDIYAPDESGMVYGVITRPGKTSLDDIDVYINFEMNWDNDSIDFDWEPDGEPTYVPYGSQSVLYDDGTGGLASVDASHAVDVYDHQFVDSDDNVLSEDQVLELLACTEAELDSIMSEFYKLVCSNTAISLEDYFMDNWPEKKEYEPDEYDSWRDAQYD